MTTDWLLRVANGDNLIRSSKHSIWGIDSQTSFGKHFVNNVKPGDRLWFIKSKSQGKIIAVATYQYHNKREVGPLVSTTLTNEELGWTREGTDWETSDIEIHYSELYNLNACEMYTHIKGAATIRTYNSKCLVQLPHEYCYIRKYSKVSFEL